MVPDNGAKKSWMARLCGKRGLHRRVSLGSGPASGFTVPAQSVLTLGIFNFWHLNPARGKTDINPPSTMMTAGVRSL